MKSDTRSFYERAVQRAVDYAGGHLDDAVDLDAHEAFTRAFGERYGTSPTGFRERRYQRTELAATCGVHFSADGAVATVVTQDSGGRPMTVSIVNRPALHVAAVRHVGPYNQINVAFGQLGQALGPAAAQFFAGGAEMLALYYDDPDAISPDELRSDAAVSIPEGLQAPPGLTEQHLPGGRYACTIHVGPYEQLGDVWARLMGEWLPASGEWAADTPSYEVYLNDPGTTPKAELKTALYVPLCRAAEESR